MIPSIDGGTLQYSGTTQSNSLRKPSKNPFSLFWKGKIAIPSIRKYNVRRRMYNVRLRKYNVRLRMYNVRLRKYNVRLRKYNVRLFCPF